MNKQKINSAYGIMNDVPLYVDTDSAKQSRPKSEMEKIFQSPEVTIEWFLKHERLCFMIKNIAHMESCGMKPVISKIVNPTDNTVIGYSIMAGQSAQLDLIEVFNFAEEVNEDNDGGERYYPVLKEVGKI